MPMKLNADGVRPSIDALARIASARHSSARIRAHAGRHRRHFYDSGGDGKTTGALFPRRSSWQPLDAWQVHRQSRMLQQKSIAERKRLVGLEPKRADVIFAGAYLIESIMTRFHADAVIVSDQGVRYGLLHEAAKAL